MTNQEIFDQQAKELASVQAMQLAMPPEGGYMLAAVVQAAAMSLNLPETTQAFCREFVDAFCDHYRDHLPTVVEAIEDAWDEDMVTEDEFEESLGEKLQRIARDIEAEMNGQVKIIVDTNCHQGALCPVNGEPCSSSKEGVFYYYPNNCPDYAICREIAPRVHESDDYDY